MAKKEAVPSRTKRAGARRTNSKQVLVWSEVGGSIPIGDTYAHVRFSFGHERIAKNDTEKEIRRVAKLVDDFNEDEFNRRLKKYALLVSQALRDSEEESMTPRQRKARKKAHRK